MFIFILQLAQFTTLGEDFPSIDVVLGNFNERTAESSTLFLLDSLIMLRPSFDFDMIPSAYSNSSAEFSCLRVTQGEFGGGL
jgi:hypothetical protein